MEATKDIVKKSNTKGSRKGKKQWRKNVDLQDVEITLENLEKQKIEFGTKISEKADEDLFTLDVGGDEEVRKEIKNKKSTRDRLLEKRSEVPAIISSRNQKKSAKKIAMKPVKIQSTITKSKPTKKKVEDLWAEEPEKKDTEKNEYLEHLEEKPVKRPENLDKKEKVKTNTIHPGSSYKPTKENHKELRKMNEKVKNKLSEFKPAKLGDEAIVGRVNIVQAAEEMVQVINEEDQAENEEGGEKIIKKKTKALTKKDKKKKLIRKENERRHLQKLARKKQFKDIDNVKDINEEIEKHQIDKAEHREVIAAKKESEKAKEPAMVGKKRALLNDVEYTSKLPETLRQVKTKTNLFKDQFINVQKSNALEPISGPNKKIKGWKKQYTLNSHK